MTPARPQPLSAFDQWRTVCCVVTDVDGTLTDGAALRADVYAALEALSAAGVTLVAATGRSAGWADLMIRQWPIHAAVAENGAVAYAKTAGGIRRLLCLDPDEAAARRSALMAAAEQAMAQVPGAAFAGDNVFRLIDVALDHAEDVAPLEAESVDRLAAALKAAGAQTLRSSIHLHGLPVDTPVSKVTGARLALSALGHDLDDLINQGAVLGIGDAPNDQALFADLPVSVGLANIRPTLPSLAPPPTHLCDQPGGRGFLQIAERLLHARGIALPRFSAPDTRL